MPRSGAGKYRHRVEVQRATETRDAHGGLVQTWETLPARWAAVEPLSGNEAAYARETYPGVTHQITMRYYSGLVPKDRLLFKGRTIEIEAVLNPDERGIETVVMGKEVVT